MTSPYLRSSFALISFVLVAACTQAPSPTSPSRLSPIGDASSALSSWAAQSHGAAIADWACLTRGDACLINPAFEMPPAEDAPSAPANLAFQVSGSTVILTWSPPAGGGAVATYLLEAGTAAGQSNIVTAATGSTATTFTATGVPNGTYFVRVRARNADGTGSASNEVTIVVGQAPCSTPAAPTGLTPGGGGNTVALSWIGVSGATSYVIEAGSATGAANLANVDTQSTATSFSAVAPNGTYYIRVRARTSCGTSGPSNEVVIVVGSAPSPPSPVTGRWRGVSPEGMIADPGSPECPIEWDLEMDLTVSGTTVSGTATTRNRRVQFARCSDVFGAVATYDVTGTADASGAITLRFGVASPAFTLNGSVTATRMTGRFVAPNNQPGGFTVTRQ